MYDTFYRLQSRPFQLGPDPRFFFSSKGHRRAMAYLVYGAHQGEGFIVITGEVGAGKTMLAATLAQRLAAQNLVLAQVVSTRLKDDDMVRMVASAFGLVQDASKAVLLDRIEQHLLACHLQGRRVLLIVDEAQNIPPGSVEELRMLSNFVHGTRPLLQTFLLGQPEFRRILQSPAMEQLRQRVIASCHLGPAGRSRDRGLHPAPAEDRGLARRPDVRPGPPLPRSTATRAAFPRKINVFCDRLLLMGCLDNKHSLGAPEVMAMVAKRCSRSSRRNPGAWARSRRTREQQRLDRISPWIHGNAH
jgi:general secretion pathway protein A